MSYDYTELQSGDDEQQARDLSLRHTRPPAQIPGYDLTRFLGSGSFGEVWTGLDRNTGRQIAVKFYVHRGGVDWSLLSREVEKLALLFADRYVVQLLDVGWQADPPYYVMEFIENGSLEKVIQSDESRSTEQVVELFREIATGLNHAHAKGILHCDLKPANVLLDQDNRPRLADFGQSRLTDEQTPSLGTLFYMAPEQADLSAIPDARWDVYALGAILYCLLVGKPPHHNDDLLKQIEEASDLPARLACYRKWIMTRRLPDEHRKLRGVDRALGAIVDRCLQPRPSKRFPNVQSVLDALRAREQARARRPLLLLGVLGPLILLALMIYAGRETHRKALDTTENAVANEIRNSNRFAAKFVASSVAAEIERYFRAVEQVAGDPDTLSRLVKLVDGHDGELAALAAVDQSDDEIGVRKKQFLEDADRLVLQDRINTLYREVIAPLENRSPPQVVSLYVCGPRGTHLAGAFPSGSTATIGDNFAFRSYCNGGAKDREESARPLPDEHVTKTSLSSPLSSKLNQRWKIAISTPVYRPDDPDKFLGVVVMSVEVGQIVGDHLRPNGVQKETASTDRSDHAPASSQFAIVVDRRDNGFQGMVLDHPMFRSGREIKANLSELRVPLDTKSGGELSFTDPFGAVEGGEAYDRQWIAASAPVVIKGEDEPSLVVFVQEDKNFALTPVRDMGRELGDLGKRALLQFLVVVGLLWCFALFAQGGPRWWKRTPFATATSIATPTPAHSRSTAAEKPVRRRK